ncbi:hypothetical protein BH10BAC3_BH10BAC3_20580 [soil metagenome]
MEDNKHTTLEMMETAGFEKAERDILKSALEKSFTERFQIMTKLMKRNLMLKKAIITHKPFVEKNN